MGASMSSAFARPLESAATDTRVYQSSWIASMNNHARLPQHNGANETMRANGLNGRTIVPERRKNTSIADTKNENGDWLAAHISRLPVSTVVEHTGMTEKAVQNVRRRKSKLSFDNLVELCRAHPEFAAAFVEHIGLLRPGEAEMAAAFTRFANAAVRAKA